MIGRERFEWADSLSGVAVTTGMVVVSAVCWYRELAEIELHSVSIETIIGFMVLRQIVGAEAGPRLMQWVAALLTVLLGTGQQREAGAVNYGNWDSTYSQQWDDKKENKINTP